MSLQPRREYHIVVLGAGGVGKSCLTAQFVQNVWIESYDPTIEDSYRKVVNVDGRQIMLEILDTAGTEQFTAMRELYMKSGHGFLLVFSITSPTSFAELRTLHTQILQIKNTTSVPLVVVGNKADMEDDRAVSRARGFELAQSMGGKPYYETSARRRTNVDEVFMNLSSQILEAEGGRRLPGAVGSVAEGIRAAGGGQLDYIGSGEGRTRRDRPNRHDRRRKERKRDRCVIL